MGEHTRYAAQLIGEGKPYLKPEHPLGQGTVGLDLGPSTIAVVADSVAQVEPFCAELDPHAIDETLPDLSVWQRQKETALGARPLL
jgi:hypothetical protein